MKEWAEETYNELFGLANEFRKLKTKALFKLASRKWRITQGNLETYSPFTGYICPACVYSLYVKDESRAHGYEPLEKYLERCEEPIRGAELDFIVELMPTKMCKGCVEDIANKEKTISVPRIKLTRMLQAIAGGALKIHAMETLKDGRK